MTDTSTTTRSNIVFTVVLLAACALLWYLRDLLLLVYASILFAVLLEPLVQKLQQGGLPRGAAIGLVFAAGVALLILLLFLLLPPLLNQTNGLAAMWPQTSASLLQALQKLPGLHNFDFSHLEAHMGLAGTWALGAAQNLASFVLDSFTVLLLTVYFLVDGMTTRKWCLSFFAPETRLRLSLALDRGQRRMRGWLLGQALLALILSATSAIVYAGLRVPYFYVLAIVTGLLSFVPILGQVAAAAVTAAVAATQSWEKMAGVLVFFAVYQMLDNGYLTPTVMRDAVDVPGLGVIIALAMGAALGGILGAALAIPSAALAAELIAEFAHGG